MSDLYDALKIELALPEYAGLTASQKADRVTAKTEQYYAVISGVEWSELMLVNALSDSIKADSLNESSPTRFISEKLYNLDRTAGFIDFNKPTHQSLVEALVANGVATQEQADAIMGGALMSRSYCQTHFGVAYISEADILVAEER